MNNVEENNREIYSENRKKTKKQCECEYQKLVAIEEMTKIKRFRKFYRPVTLEKKRLAINGRKSCRDHKKLKKQQKYKKCQT